MKADSARYRAVLDTFWADMDVLEWAPDEKLFYLWVFTNQHLDICGCYQVSPKVMAHEVGVSLDRIQELIAKFSDLQKIRYNFDTRELLILNWKKHNEGFFKPENRNSIRAIREGAGKIKANELRGIVLEWIGGEVAPTLPLAKAPTPQPKPKPEPEPKEEPTAAASTQASTTPTPSPPVGQQQQPGKVVTIFADSENQIRTAFRELHDFLALHFPHLNLAVEVEQCVLKLRGQPLKCEAGVIVMEWCKRVPKPEARGRDRPSKQVEAVERGRANVRMAMEAIYAAEGV